MTKLLTIGIVGKSLKENEKRVAIHPAHIANIPKELRKQMTFEEDYGKKFGVSNEKIASLTSGKVASRKEIIGNFDCVLIPKPLVADLAEMREGAIVWGWPHCVQNKDMTQIAIDRKLTLIAWEAMFTWNRAGNRVMHTFYKNNELAGYCGVTHALSLIGVNGYYGEKRKAVVISFGSVSRGAIYALRAQGFNDITVYTNRKSTEVRDQVPGIVFRQMVNDENGKLRAYAPDGTTYPFSEALTDAQIIVNGIFQDTDHPKMFVPEEDKDKLMKGTIIIDISCDEGMGFWCARPTSFADPMFEVDGKFYYSVDHSPSFHWNSATWEISKALLPFLSTVVGGKESWKKNETIQKSIEIMNGVIQNPKILSFQKRAKEFPHNFLK